MHLDKEGHERQKIKENILWKEIIKTEGRKWIERRQNDE